MVIPVSHSFPSDRPWRRVSVSKLTNEELDQWLEGIRERRLQLIRAYEEQQEFIRTTRNEQLAQACQKQLNMMDRDFTTFENAFGRLEKRIINIMAMRLEAGEL